MNVATNDQKNQVIRADGEVHIDLQAPEAADANAKMDYAAGKDLHSIIGDPLFVDPEHGDFRPKTCDGDAAGSAVGAWQNIRGESVCDAGFLPAPGDTAVVRAA